VKYIIFVVVMLGTACLIQISGFAFPTWIALLVLILAIASDFLTTWACLRKQGREGNPVTALLFRKIGLYKTFGLMAGIWVCFIVFRWLGTTAASQTAVALVYWMIPMNNTVVLVKLNRKTARCVNLSTQPAN
jgi:phosphatidylglycerophosphate synthase